MYRRPGRSGQHREFRLDRILSVRDPPPRAGYFDFADKVRRRDVRDAVMGVFLDLLLIAMVLGLAVTALLKLAEYFGICCNGWLPSRDP
jgi:hypothetical protein